MSIAHYQAASSARRVAAILDRSCASCGKRQPGMIELPGTRQLPGPWWLCGSCYGTPGEKPQPIGRGKRR